jgi:tetratricopeptide (TPR) repeat protein
MLWRQRVPRIAPVGAAAGLVLLAAAWLRPLRPTVITVPTPVFAAAPRAGVSPAMPATLAAPPPTAVASSRAPASAPAAESARTEKPTPAPPQTVTPPQVVASREPSPKEEISDGHRAEPEPTRARRAGHPSARKPPPQSGKAHSSGGDLTQLVKQGDSALRSGRVDDALKSFNQAIAENPKFAPAHRGLGSVFVMQGRDSDAKAAYKRYLALAPNAPDAPRIQALLQDM